MSKISAVLLFIIALMVGLMIGIHIGIHKEKNSPKRVEVVYDYNTQVDYTVKPDSLLHLDCNAKVVRFRK